MPFNIVKIAILTKAIYRFNAISIKLPMTFFTELEQIIIKFIQNHERPQIAKAILRLKNKAGGITLPDFRQWQKAEVIKTAWYWHKNRPVGQNREPQNKPAHLWKINLQQRRQKCQMGKRWSLQQAVWKSWTAACKSMKLEHPLTPCLHSH